MTTVDDLPPPDGADPKYGRWWGEQAVEEIKRAYALAARAERDAEIERLNGLLLLGRDNAGTAKLLHDELKALLAQRDERIMELESLEQDINREYRLKLEVAEARVRELEPYVETCQRMILERDALRVRLEVIQRQPTVAILYGAATRLVGPCTYRDTSIGTSIELIERPELP